MKTLTTLTHTHATWVSSNLQKNLTLPKLTEKRYTRDQTDRNLAWMISPDFVNYLKPYPTEFLKNVFQIFWWHFIKKWENIDTIRILITISDFQLKQITTQEDQNTHTYYLFYLVVLAVENSRKTLLLVMYRNQVFLYFHL